MQPTMALKFKILFGMTYPFMNTEYVFLQKKKTIGKELVTCITPGNIH